MATQVIPARPADLVSLRSQPVTARRLRELYARIDGWLAERRHYRATVAELSALTDQQLADVGVLPGQIQAIARQLARRAGTGR
jgi:uncharacterized protein YjiS (DUF1127 family)